ncbi:MAG: DMT family transporter [Nocardioidaceae bacterium]
MTAALLLALACAATFAVSTSVQHHAAEHAPASASGLFGLLGYLLRRPLWLLGQLLATLGFVFHALALHAGALAVVQPVVVSGIVWAVPLRSAMSRHWPSRAEVGAVVLVATGLAAFLVASDPTPGGQVGLGAGTLALIGGGAVLALLANLLAGRAQPPRRRAFWLGVTAGVLFGMVAGLLKMTLQTANADGLVGVLTTWPSYALLVAGAGGVLTNQRAYRVAGLSASMPVLNIVNVLVALTLGLLVFDEVPRHTPLLLVVEALSLAAIGVGLVLLVRLEETFLAGEPGAADSTMSAPGVHQ